MTTTEAMKLVLEALENAEDQLAKPYSTGARYAITALREALAEHCVCGEPNTPGTHRTDGPCLVERPAQRTWVEMSDARIKGIFSYHGQFASGKDLPMLRVIEAMLKENASPQRTWVGLTDEEIDQGLLRSDYAFKTAEAWRAGVVFAMAKLKEKNCG